jgi:hypothetical protein
MKTYLGEIKDLPPKGIFVFGSNTQGRHGKGAALVAYQRFGAIYGQSKGLQGRSYAICTKDLTKRKHPSVSKEYIRAQIGHLYYVAKKNHNLDFYIAYQANSQNLNGYTPDEMAEMFATPILIPEDNLIPENIIFEFNFYQLLRKHCKVEKRIKLKG